MRPEIKELLQDRLESFVTEYLNDAAKNADGGCCGVHISVTFVSPRERRLQFFLADESCRAMKQELSSMNSLT